jgi:transposase InsO family protein
MDTAAITTAIEHWSVYYRPHVDYNIQDLKEIYSDAGSQFKSEYLKEWCTSNSRLIVTKIAAPHHQSTNGLTENRWKNTRLRCQKMLSHARLDARFFDVCIIYAALVTNLSPLRNLTIAEINGETRPTTPFELYFGHKPEIRRLRTWGCPVIFKAYQRNKLNDKNIIQRGVRGIFVGFPLNQAGYLLWVDQVGQFIVSDNVMFDENFSSILAYNRAPFHDALEHPQRG